MCVMNKPRNFCLATLPHSLPLPLFLPLLSTRCNELRSHCHCCCWSQRASAVNKTDKHSNFCYKNIWLDKRERRGWGGGEFCACFLSWQRCLLAKQVLLKEHKGERWACPKALIVCSVSRKGSPFAAVISPHQIYMQFTMPAIAGCFGYPVLNSLARAYSTLKCIWKFSELTSALLCTNTEIILLIYALVKVFEISVKSRVFGFSVYLAYLHLFFSVILSFLLFILLNI